MATDFKNLTRRVEEGKVKGGKGTPKKGTSLADAFIQRELTPPKPSKHPLRNYDLDKLAKVMADPRFQVDTMGLTVEKYADYLSGLTGQSIVDFQKAMSDPNSNLRQAQQTDFMALLGSKGASMQQFTLPGAKGYLKGQQVILDPTYYSGYATGTNYPEGFSPESDSIVKDLIDAMGREDLQKNFNVYSIVSSDTNKRHELAHRGITILQNKGVRIDYDTEEEPIMKLLDYALGDDYGRRQAIAYFDQDKNMTISEAYKKHKDLLKKVLKAAFKELGGVEIPKPYFIK